MGSYCNAVNSKHNLIAKIYTIEYKIRVVVMHAQTKTCKEIILAVYVVQYTMLNFIYL